MKFIIDGRKFNVDIRSVKGIRFTYKGMHGQDSFFSCTIHSWEGTKRELRTHLKALHPDLFTVKEVEA